MQARLPIAVKCYRSSRMQTCILGIMLLINDHLQGKALAAANREGKGATGRARGSAPGQPLNPVQRLRHARMPVQSYAAREARALLPSQFYAQGEEQLEVCAQGRSRRHPPGTEELRGHEDAGGQLDRSGYRAIQPPTGQQAPLTERRTWHCPVMRKIDHFLSRRHLRWTTEERSPWPAWPRNTCSVAQP